MLGNSTKLATSGPSAPPVVLNSVVTPVLFIRSSTLDCTCATMPGNTMPDKNETGNIKASESSPICGHDVTLKEPAGVLIISPGKKKYESNATVAASSKNIGSRLTDALSRR